MIFLRAIYLILRNRKFNKNETGIEMNGDGNKRIGQYLEKLQQQRGLTQEQLAAKLQIFYVEILGKY